MISGIYVPILTAFSDNGHIDTGACADFAQWLVDQGVDGLVPFGSTGEGPSLSMRERLAILPKLAEAAHGTPLVPAITESSLDAVLDFVSVVNDLPADGLMVLPPYYYRPLATDQLRRFIEPVLAASKHPVILYHIPQFGPPVPVEALAGLALWGVKDSGDDLAYTRSVLEAGSKVMVGSERDLVEAVEIGAAGGILGMANLLPGHLVAGCAAAQRGDTVLAATTLAPELGFRERLMAASHEGPMGWLSVVKHLAGRRSGVPLGDVRPPVPSAPVDTSTALIPHLETVLSELAETRLPPGP